jgi:transposase InsO family protein
MPWKETAVPDERMRFVLACLDEEDSMAALCRRFGVSRPTGYGWLARYKECGPPGLADRSRAPHSHPNQTQAAVEARILATRAKHPTWGARKLLAAVARRCEKDGEALDLPAASTAGQLLKRHGLAASRRRRSGSSSAPAGVDPAAACAAPGPNRLWCADFKGWFRTGDGARCDPLTVSDAHSRYLLRCQIAPDLGHAWARGQFEAAFREYGLPDAIRTDNGAPFATTGLMGLGRLSAWWLRLGIAHQRIEPGRPQQNGSHERMHGTLKRQTASPPARTLRAQQVRFDAFRAEYNDERPHEGLAGMATPASLYAPGARAYPDRLPQLEYPEDHVPRHVDANGRFRWGGAEVFLSHALAGQTVGFLPLGTDPARCAGGPGRGGRYWAVRFARVELGVFDEQRGRLLRPRERRHLEVT